MSSAPSTPMATYADALRFAQAKGKHHRPPGSTELPPDPWGWAGGWSSPASVCLGQLRSSYARLTVAPGSGPLGIYYRQAGKPKWVPVGVWCDACGAFWPKPIEPAG